MERIEFRDFEVILEKFASFRGAKAVLAQKDAPSSSGMGFYLAHLPPMPRRPAPGGDSTKSWYDLDVGESLVIGSSRFTDSMWKLITLPRSMAAAVNEVENGGVKQGWEVKVYRGKKDTMLIWYVPEDTMLDSASVSEAGRCDLLDFRPFKTYFLVALAVSVIKFTLNGYGYSMMKN